MRADASGACGDHQKLAQVDAAGDEVRRDLQKRLQVRASHVGIETFVRAPVLVDEPNIGIVARLMKVIVETFTLARVGSTRAERAKPSDRVWPGLARKKARFVSWVMDVFLERCEAPASGA